MDSKGNSTVVWILRIVYSSYTAFGMALACMTNHVTFGKADIYIYFTMWQSMRCGCFCNITGEYAGNQVWRDERVWTCGYRNLRLRCIVVIVG